MALLAKVNLNINVQDEEFVTVLGEKEVATFAPASLLPKRERVTLTLSAFTALSPPSGAVAVAILLPTTIINLTLKGVTGDTGVALIPSTNPKGIPLIIPLGTSPSIGIANAHTSNQVITVVWM